MPIRIRRSLLIMICGAGLSSGLAATASAGLLLTNHCVPVDAAH